MSKDTYKTPYCCEIHGGTCPWHRLRGNLLDKWDQMANDTQELIRETETGFYNAVEALRPRD